MAHNNSSRYKIIATIFIILSFPSLFLAFIAMISGAYNINGTLEMLFDRSMRILFIGIPISLFIAGIGLFAKRNWAKYLTVITAGILGFTCLYYGIIGLYDYGSENAVFSSVCFILTIFFSWSAYYVIKH